MATLARLRLPLVRVVASQRGVPGDEARRAAVLKMSEIWAEDVPDAIVGAVEEVIMFDESVTGIVPTQQSMYVFQDARVES